MKDISKEIMELLERYGTDTKRALEENSRLEYLYALSDIRENLLEWYPFRKEGSILQIGSDYGAMTGLYGRRVKEVVVLDPSADNLRVNAMRHQGAGNITYTEGNLLQYARAQKTEEGKRFDYVIFVGTLVPDYEDHIRAAKSLLNPGGELILAVCNSFGMKYWAGAQKDEDSFSKKKITGLVQGKDEIAPGFYYPMPDYKLPVTIYSEDYLPGKGDLTDTIIAYDYPKYLLLDVGAAYDAVCEDGQFENFANSFLVIWRNHETD